MYQILALHINDLRERWLTLHMIVTSLVKEF